MRTLKTSKRGQSPNSSPDQLLTKKLFEMVKITKSSPVSQRNGVKKEFNRTNTCLTACYTT